MVAGALLLFVAWPTRRLWLEPVRLRRILVLLGIAAIGIVGATGLPNALDWKSDTPYLDSVRGVVNYREGSGRGRLVQYRNSLDMALHHPLLGVGPGNWPVDYPRYASRNDPSLDQDDGMTSNPWPSSDWVAYVSERGVLATACLALALLGTLVAARQKGTAQDPVRQLEAIVLAATVLVTLVVSMFDAVLLLAAPTFFVWAIVGALMPEMAIRRSLAVLWRRLAALGGAVVMLAAASRSVLQVRAMAHYDVGTVRALREAALLDPGSYRIHLRLAIQYARRGYCPGVREEAGAASRRFPNAAEPKRMLQNCAR
jgi:hypothetical protein